MIMPNILSNYHHFKDIVLILKQAPSAISAKEYWYPVRALLYLLDTQIKDAANLSDVKKQSIVNI